VANEPAAVLNVVTPGPGRAITTLNTHTVLNVVTPGDPHDRYDVEHRVTVPPGAPYRAAA
jgi:hypothetical protein